MRTSEFVKFLVLLIGITTLFACGSADDATTDNAANDPAADALHSKLPPVAVISPASNQSIRVDDSIVFTGDSSSDPDNNVPLTYMWHFTGVQTEAPDATGTLVPITYSNKANPGAITFTAVGTVYVRLRVSDSRGTRSDWATMVVTVNAAEVPNLPPDAEITYKDSSGALKTGDVSVVTGKSVEFAARTSDPENDPITGYSWSIPAGVTAPATPGAGSFNLSFDTAGRYPISLTVTDAAGNTDPSPASINVTVTAPPVIVPPPVANLAPNGSINHNVGNGTAGTITIPTNTTVVFTGSAVDDGNTLFTYTWSFPTGVTAPATPGADPFSATFPNAGSFTVRLTVTDNLGLPDPTPATVTVTVTDPPVANTPPDGSISYNVAGGTPTAISILSGTTVEFRGSAVDTGNTIFAYAWSFPTGVTAPAAPGADPFSVTFPNAGSFTVQLTVTDNLGLPDPTPATVTVTVTDPPVTNPPPPVANLAPNGSISHDNGTGVTGSVGDISILTNTTVVFNGSAVDPESNPVTYTWAFTGTTVPNTAIAGPISATYATAGSFTVRLTVSDNQNNTDPTPALVNVTVTNPPPPVANLAPNGSISHDNGTGATGSVGDIRILTNTTVVFNGSAVDPESNPVTYAWAFTGTTVPNTAIAGPISATYTTAGSFTVQLTVTDNLRLPDPTPAVVNVTVTPSFQHLPVLSDSDGDPNNASATYALSVDADVPVKVVTPNGTWTTPMMRYNGSQLPPVIKAKRGTNINVNVTNNLGAVTTVHWHGFKVPAAQDGGPFSPIAANGGSRLYQFKLEQAAAPLWFHPHAHGTTASQVYNGLAGAFIVTDDISNDLEQVKQLPSGELGKQLPSGEQDIAMMIQDRSFNVPAPSSPGVRALIPQSELGTMMDPAALGDIILVNGVQMPALKVTNRQYRFRLYNGSNARTYNIALSDGTRFHVVGTDGGLLNTPVSTDRVMLGAGERSEIVVAFNNYNAGESVMLISRAFPAEMMGGGGALPNGAEFDIMRFDIDTAVTDNVTLYSSLPDTADIRTRLNPSAPGVVTRPFVMSVSGGMMGGNILFRINDRSFDPTGVRVDVPVTAGATEIWNISNPGTGMMAMAHPFHAHAIQWQVLKRNGMDAAGTDLGWKDTVLVQPGETVSIIGKFDPVINIGKYVYHCHILEHEEAGMMGTFEVKAPPPL